MLIDLKAKYNVNPSGRKKEIIRLLKKYDLYKEESYKYEFKNNELEMYIEQQHLPSYLFLPEQTDAKYKELIEKALGIDREGSLELASLYNFSLNSSDAIRKSISSLIKKANTCKDKMLRQLEKIDADEKSEKLTEIYLEQMSDSVQKILELSMLKNEAEWKRIGVILKSYLSKLGFFVPDDIEDSVKSKYISTSLSHPKSTQNRMEHGKISYFNSLPYCIYYYDSDEEAPEMRTIEGICTYYKYKE